MEIGLVQPVVGSVGGNDAVLNAMINALKDHTITLYTFSKVKLDNITVKTKIPVHLPLLGIYQKWFMPKFDYNECDLYISTTGMNIKTDKPLIIYDQNNLGLEFANNTIPQKYKNGLWRLYYQPYKMFNKPDVNRKARYVCNSNYSKIMLDEYVLQDIDVLYPGVNLDECFDRPKKKQICMVGRISPEKNLEFAVKVLNKVPYDSWILGSVTKSNMSYYHKLDSMTEDHVTVSPNPERDIILKILSQSKVYFSSSKETFGISTVEAMTSGCIPIVPDNSAHPETVPLEELRYTDIDSAVSKLCNAMNDNYDHRIDALRKHIKKFDIEKFNEGIVKLVG